MKTYFFVLILLGSLCFALPLEVACAKEVPAGNESAWRDLFAELTPKAGVYSVFTEHRWFPFRKIPVVLKGELRFSREFGLSLHYTEPEERIVLADEKGLLIRSTSGKTRTLAADPRALESGHALMSIMRFDYDELRKNFEIQGQRSGSAWSITFVPLDPKIERSLGKIEVSGENAAVLKLEFKRSALQRIEIMIGETRLLSRFEPEELRRFFR